MDEKALQIIEDIEEYSNTIKKLSNKIGILNTRVKQAIKSAELNNVLNFICFLIDNHEGDKISEEYLQQRLADFIKSAYYRAVMEDA